MYSYILVYCVLNCTDKLKAFLSADKIIFKHLKCARYCILISSIIEIEKFRHILFKWPSYTQSMPILPN